MEKRFAVKNARGKNVFSIDAKGDGFMDGQVKPCYGGGCEGEGEGEGEGQTPSLDDLKAAGGKWVIQDGNGTVLAVVDPEWNTTQLTDHQGNPADAQWPTLYLKGRLVKQPVTFQGPSVTLTPPDGSFVIKNSDGVVAAYINSVTDGDSNPPGSLVLAGYFFEGHNPDPQAMKTVFLFYDSFELTSGRTSLCSQCVTRWSPDAYTQCPEWSQDSGSWSITSDGDAGTCATGGAGGISIPQTHADADTSLDFEYQLDSGNVSPAQIVFRKTASDSLCLLIDPKEPSATNHTVLKIRQQSVTQDLASVDITSLIDPTKLNDSTDLPGGHSVDSFLPNPTYPDQITWYQVHIQAVGNGIHVLFRRRDGDYIIPSTPSKDSGAGYKWIQWNPAIQLPELTGDQTQLTLVVSGSVGLWSFDNVIVNSMSYPN